MTSHSLPDLLASTNKVVLVDVWAPWCAPCRAMLPVLEQVAAAFPQDLILTTLNADEHPDYVEQLAIKTLPTLLLMKDGREAGRRQGIQSESQLTSFVASFVRLPLNEQLIRAEEDLSQERYAAGIQTLQSVIAQEPANLSAYTALLKALLADADTFLLQPQRQALAAAYLQNMPPDLQRNPQLAQLCSRVRRLQALAAQPLDWDAITSQAQQSDAEAIRLLSQRLTATNRYQEAAELLLQHMAQAPSGVRHDLLQSELVALLDVIPDRMYANVIRRQMFALSEA